MHALDISYSFYPVYCGLYGIDSIAIPLDENFRIRIDDYARDNGGIILANPNAPTGQLLPLIEIERLLTAHPNSVCVIDEAYVDFGGDNVIAIRVYNNNGAGGLYAGPLGPVGIK